MGGSSFCSYDTRKKDSGEQGETTRGGGSGGECPHAIPCNTPCHRMPTRPFNAKFVRRSCVYHAIAKANTKRRRSTATAVSANKRTEKEKCNNTVKVNLYAYSSGEIHRDKEKKSMSLNHEHIPLFLALFARHRTEQDRSSFLPSPTIRVSLRIPSPPGGGTIL